MVNLAQVFFELEEIQQATSSYRQVLAEAREEGPMHALCNALSARAALCYECNELESADQYAQAAITISQPLHLVHYEGNAMLIPCRWQQAQGHAFVAQP